MGLRRPLFTLPLFACLLLSTGCTSLPTVTVYRPWTRTLGDSKSLPAGASVHIEAHGSTPFLAGSETLLQGAAAERLRDALERRGFAIAGPEAEYRIVLSYKTERHEYLSSQSSASSRSVSSSSAGSRAAAAQGSALGVLIASVLSASVSGSASAAQTTTQTEVTYVHSLSIECLDRQGVTVWKGESTRDAEDLDILDIMDWPLQLLLAQLPVKDGYVPRVREVRIGREKTFFRLECNGIWFRCPAIPNYIFFENDRYSESYPGSISQPRALAAYADLIQTAEEALPTGDDDYSDVTDRNLWKKLLLAKKYIIGTDAAPVIVMVSLRSDKPGYTITKCWLGSEVEYQSYNRRMGEWKAALQRYFDYIVR